MREVTEILPVSSQISLKNPEHLGDGPRLRHCAPRMMRRVPVIDLAERSQTSSGEFLLEWPKQFAAVGDGLGPTPMHLQVRRDKRADQPWPHRALMVSAVTLQRPAPIAAPVVRMPRLARAQTGWLQQHPLHRLQDRLALCLTEQPGRESHTE